MTITARNIGRINVWPTYDVAREADTGECEFVGQLTVWRTADEARANMTHEEGGGGGDEPLIFIDFVNDTATNDGATVAIDTLVGNDPASDTPWGPTDYDTDYLGPNGYGGLDAPNPAFLGDLRTAYLAGATVVFRFKVEEGASGSTIMMLSADGNDGMDTIFGLSSPFRANIGSWNGSLDASVPGVINTGAGAINVLATTIIDTRAEIAANGSAAATGVVEDEDRPAANPFTVAMIDMSNNFIQSITVYAALPDTDGLSELSEI